MLAEEVPVLELEHSELRHDARQLRTEVDRDRSEPTRHRPLSHTRRFNRMPPGTRALNELRGWQGLSNASAKRTEKGPRHAARRHRVSDGSVCAIEQNVAVRGKASYPRPLTAAEAATRRTSSAAMAEIPPTYAETDYAGSDPEAQAPALTDRGGASSTTGSSVLSAGAWAAASRLLPQVYSLAMSVVAARFLGPEGMGRQSLIAFSAIFATTAATLGVPTALMRFVGERVGGGAVNAIRPLVRAVWRVEAVAAALGAAVLI